MKKTLKILIICLLIILVLGCASFAGLYLYSDLFKTNKELFFKYASQIDSKKFIDKEFYNSFSNKLKNSIYEDNTKININIDSDETIQKEIDITKKVDKQNEMNNSEIIVRDNGETELTLEYLRNDDLYGVLIKDIINQYIVLENNNLKDFAEKIGVANTAQIPNKIETTNIDEIITEKELNEICQRYEKIIFEQIPDESYSKVEKQQIAIADKQVEASGYKISIKANQLQEILKIVSQNLKNDTQIFGIISKFNEEISLEQYQESFEELLEKLAEDSLSEKNEEILTITVYKQSGKTIKLYIEFEIEEQSIEVSLENIDSNPVIEINVGNQSLYTDEVSYTNIIISKTMNTKEKETWDITISTDSLDGNSMSPITINIGRSGTVESSTINNVLQIAYQDESMRNINIKYSNTIEFRDDLEFEDFEEGEYVIINDLTEEQIQNLFTGVEKLISEKTQEDQTVYLYGIIGLINALIEGTPYEQVAADTVVGAGITLSVSLQGGLIEKVQDTQELQQKMVEQELQLQEQQQETLEEYYNNSELDIEN